MSDDFFDSRWVDDADRRLLIVRDGESSCGSLCDYFNAISCGVYFLW